MMPVPLAFCIPFACTVDGIGEDNRVWGSDFPHPDGVWPDSQEYIQREVGRLPEGTGKKRVCDNAAKLYRFVN